MGNNITSFQGTAPAIDSTAFVDISARVIGDVAIAEGVSVWPMAVIRADTASIFIERRAAVLDLGLIESPEGCPVKVGEESLISHGAIVHGATIEPNVLIGVGAILLDNAVVGAGSIVAAGAVITPGTVIPPNSFVLGSPGRVTRQTTPGERENLKRLIDELFVRSRIHLDEQHDPPSL